MRSRRLISTSVSIVLLAVVAQACVGDDPIVAPPPTTSPDAGTSQTPTTDAGGPQLPTCGADQLLCDGACVDIGPAHCGSCSTECPSSAPLCSSGTGTPTCVASCALGQTKCGDQCVDTSTNPSNCGACGNKCATPLNGVATCANSTCDFTCKPNFHACGDTCAADDDVTKCGPTCKACAVPANGTPTCNGQCGFSCSGGLTACPTQNVCANLTNDKNNCGACGKVCQIATSCSSSICPVTAGYSTPYTAESTAVASAEFTAIRVDIAAPITVTALGMYHRGFVAQHEVWLGLYTNNGGHPGTLIVAAKVLVTGTGSKVLNVMPTPIAAGTYFIGATQSGFANYGLNSNVGTYEYFKNGSTSLWNASAALSTAPATGTFSGSHNFWLVGKE